MTHFPSLVLDSSLQWCPPSSPEQPSGGPSTTGLSLVLPITPGEVVYMTPPPPLTPDLPAPTSDPEPRIDSSLFWRNCNVAGCTQAIFADFINGMNDIFSRVQAEEASQEGKRGNEMLRCVIIATSDYLC